jgi:hypothetical protein
LNSDHGGPSYATAGASCPAGLPAGVTGTAASHPASLPPRSA